MYPTYAPYTIAPGTCDLCAAVTAVAWSNIIGYLVWGVLFG